jgi:hypothetical protein
MKAPTSDQLRDRIDSGRTGEKIGFPDPAAAPLGTDDEAAGTPPTEAERRLAPASDPESPAPRPRTGIWRYLAAMGFVAVVLILVVLLAPA